MNNKGVTLINKGMLDEALYYFDEAVAGLPNNRQVLMNATKVKLLYMQKKGKDKLHQVRQYLDTLSELWETDAELNKIQRAFEKINRS